MLEGWLSLSRHQKDSLRLALDLFQVRRAIREMSYRSLRSITGRDQNGHLLDLGIVLIFAEILNVLNKGSGEDSLDFLGFLTLPPTTSRL